MSPCRPPHRGPWSFFRVAGVAVSPRTDRLHACRVTLSVAGLGISFVSTVSPCRPLSHVTRRPHRIRSITCKANPKGREWTGKRGQPSPAETPRLAWIVASAESMPIRHLRYPARLQGLGRLGSTPPRRVQSPFFRQIRNAKTSRIRDFPDARPSPSASPHNPLYSGLSPVCSGQS